MSLTSTDLALALGRLRPGRRRRTPAARQPTGVRRLGLHAARDAQLRELRLYRPPV